MTDEGLTTCPDCGQLGFEGSRLCCKKAMLREYVADFGSYVSPLTADGTVKLSITRGNLPKTEWNQ